METSYPTAAARPLGGSDSLIADVTLNDALLRMSSAERLRETTVWRRSPLS